MTIARKEVVYEDEESEYHCISRCVRRAFLCGFDVLTGKSFDHRKDWIRERLIFLSKIFTIDVLAYALMSNHQHTLLRTRPDILRSLSDKEVAKRWLALYPTYLKDDVSVNALLVDKERLAVLRARLGSVSWFMKSLNEFIARKANKEDKCTGRFWEGRFKCQRLEDDASVLACAVYIDLNPIRAKVATTPETSVYTSAYERIEILKGKTSDTWLTPIPFEHKRRGFLSITLSEYLSILDETGKELVHGKRGAISKSVSPILDRIGISSAQWLSTARHCGKWFASVMGNKSSLEAAAKELGRAWLKGTSVSSVIFS